MKKVLLASAVALGIAGTASAADLPVKAPVAAPAFAPIPVFSWTGCYIGGHVGYGKGHSSHNFQFDDVRKNFSGDENQAAEFYFTDNFNLKGGLGGLQGGCNYQYHHFVLGLEGDYSWADLHADRNFVEPLTEGTPDTASFSSKVSALASIRGRFGLAEDRAFLYVTMGWAWARYKYSYHLFDEDGATGCSEPCSVGASFSNTPSGIVAGAGINYALTDWLILRAEYLHYALGQDYLLPSSVTSSSSSFVGPGTNDHHTIKDIDVIRVGADWKFNWWGKAPVAARY